MAAQRDSCGSTLQASWPGLAASSLHQLCIGTAPHTSAPSHTQRLPHAFRDCPSQPAPPTSSALAYWHLNSRLANRPEQSAASCSLVGAARWRWCRKSPPIRTLLPREPAHYKVGSNGRQVVTRQNLQSPKLTITLHCQSAGPAEAPPTRTPMYCRRPLARSPTAASVELQPAPVCESRQKARRLAPLPPPCCWQ